MKNSPFKLLLKITVAIAGLYLAYRQLDWGPIFAVLKEYNFWFIALGIMINLLSNIFLAFRLKIVSGSSRDVLWFFRVNVIASFFNLFLPSTVGGDTIKVKRISDESKSLQKSLINVLMDRFYGVTALVIINLITVLISVTTNSFPLDNNLLLFVVAFSTFVAIAWLVIIRFDMVKIFKKIPFISRKFNLTNLLEALNNIKHVERKKALLLIGISILYQLNAAVITSIGLISVGIHINFLYVTLISSITASVLMVPISIGGLGARDVLYKELYGNATSAPQVVLLAPYILTVLVGTGLLGGIMYLLEKEKTNE